MGAREPLAVALRAGNQEPSLEIRNRQRARRPDLRLLRRIALHVLHQELRAREYELGVYLVDAPEMARLNETFLQHTGSTDVITFDYSEGQHAQSGILRGEIFVSVPDAIVQAKQFGTTWQSEVARYVIHGLLHLRGYDDLAPAARKIMKREENRLVKAVEREFLNRGIRGSAEGKRHIPGR